MERAVATISSERRLVGSRPPGSRAQAGERSNVAMSHVTWL